MSTKDHRLSLAGILALASVTAFVAGRLSAPEGGDRSAQQAGDDMLPAKISERGTSTTAGGKAIRGKQGPPSEKADGRDRDATLARMEELMRTADPLERTRAWLEFVNSIAPGDFESVVASFRALGITDSRMGEYSMLLSAWAKSDPLQALDYAQANTGNPFARNTILTAWAGYDPEGAIQWANNNHNGDGANPWMIGVIRGIAANDPLRASQLLASMPYSEERGEALGALLPSILAQGHDAARAWAEAIPDEMLRQGAIGRLAETMAAKDPAATAEWLARNGGEAADRSMDNVISSWMASEEAAAIAFYKNLPAGDLRSNALRGVANSLALENPAAAADFLAANSADANDRVYQQFVWHSFGESPEIAANHVGKITNPRDQERMYQRVLDSWLRRDFDNAATWIQNTALPQNVQERAQRRIAEIQQRQQ